MWSFLIQAQWLNNKLIGLVRYSTMLRLYLHFDTHIWFNVREDFVGHRRRVKANVEEEAAVVRDKAETLIRLLFFQASS